MIEFNCHFFDYVFIHTPAASVRLGNLAKISFRRKPYKTQDDLIVLSDDGTYVFMLKGDSIHTCVLSETLKYSIDNFK